MAQVPADRDRDHLPREPEASKDRGRARHSHRISLQPPTIGQRNSATSPRVAGATGGYYVKSQQREPAPAARDDAAARRLWQLSKELTGLTPARPTAEPVNPDETSGGLVLVWCHRRLDGCGGLVDPDSGG